MKKLLAFCCFSIATLALPAVEASGWTTDYKAALEQAKAGDRRVFLFFTGSDWCGWCIKFKKEVLDTNEFKGYADKNLVLVEVDFPNKKEQSEDLKKANKALKEKYSVSGYPTYVVLNGEGKEVGRQVGYAEGGPKAFIAKLDGFKKK